jgi:hypothetical protein
MTFGLVIFIFIFSLAVSLGVLVRLVAGGSVVAGQVVDDWLVCLLGVRGVRIRVGVGVGVGLFRVSIVRVLFLVQVLKAVQRTFGLLLLALVLAALMLRVQVVDDSMRRRVRAAQVVYGLGVLMPVLVSISVRSTDGVSVMMDNMRGMATEVALGVGVSGMGLRVGMRGVGGVGGVGGESVCGGFGCGVVARVRHFVVGLGVGVGTLLAVAQVGDLHVISPGQTNFLCQIPAAADVLVRHCRGAVCGDSGLSAVQAFSCLFSFVGSNLGGQGVVGSRVGAGWVGSGGRVVHR